MPKEICPRGIRGINSRLLIAHRDSRSQYRLQMPKEICPANGRKLLQEETSNEDCYRGDISIGCKSCRLKYILQEKRNFMPKDIRFVAKMKSSVKYKENK
ncbi:conserved hypothetical protein [Ricinus communis]|uniref:Uncharacterized protein n=1 Tax=Ricinus communis TaxID=3988 RepID=B9RZ98_RICCO|nr:conserved hypothetical protein [Ricinus communis]